jgi:uncharacterized protein YggE
MTLARRCTVLFVGLLLAGCAGTFVPAEHRGIAVTGTGRVASRPDTAVVEVGAETRAGRLGDATAEVDRTMRAVLAALKALGVRDPEVLTTAYAVDPVAEPRQAGDTGARIVGYRVSNVVQVRTRDVDGVGRIVDAAVRAGANVVRNVHFTIEDPLRVEAEARALAMQDAAAKARDVAAAAGVSLGRLLAVTESSPGRPVARMSLATGPGPVQPGQLETTISLDARYAIDR